MIRAPKHSPARAPASPVGYMGEDVREICYTVAVLKLQDEAVVFSRIFSHFCLYNDRSFIPAVLTR